jgi:hypothetical protein
MKHQTYNTDITDGCILATSGSAFSTSEGKKIYRKYGIELKFVFSFQQVDIRSNPWQKSVGQLN